MSVSITVQSDDLSVPVQSDDLSVPVSADNISLSGTSDAVSVLRQSESVSAAQVSSDVSVQTEAGADAPAPEPDGELDAVVATALARMGFSITLPTDPTVGSPIICTTEAQVNAAIGNGAYIQIDITDFDGIQFVIPAETTDVYITGSSPNTGEWVIGTSCARIKFEDVNVSGFDCSLPATDGEIQTDLQFVDVVGVDDGPAAHGNMFHLRGKRIVISGCSTSSIIDRFGIWIDGGPTQSTDIVVYNSSIECDGAQACTRFVSTRRLAVVENTFESGQNFCFRLHSDSLTYPSQDTYAADCTLQNRGIMLASLGAGFDHVQDVMIENFEIAMVDNGRDGVNALMDTGGAFGEVSDWQFLNNHVVTDDYYSWPDFEALIPSQDGWTFSGNTGHDTGGNPL